MPKRRKPPHSHASDLSRRIREEVRDRDLSAYRLSEDTGIDAGTIQRFLYGKRQDIRLSTASVLCHALGMRLVGPPTRRSPARNVLVRRDLRKPVHLDDDQVVEQLAGEEGGAA